MDLISKNYLAGCFSSGGGAYGLHSPAFVGKCTFLQLAVDELTVHGQLKAPPIGGLQFEGTDSCFIPAQDFPRQTDGLRLVISLAAVTQMNAHKVLLVDAADPCKRREAPPTQPY